MREQVIVESEDCKPMKGYHKEEEEEEEDEEEERNRRRIGRGG
jgi:hypothetical protein